MPDDQQVRGVTLGKTQIPPVCVPVELFSVYQPVIGHVAVSLWLNLRCAAHTGGLFDLQALDKLGIRISRAEADEALDLLESYGLLETNGAGGFIVHDPLPQEVFEIRYGSGSVRMGGRASSDLASSGRTQNGRADAGDEPGIGYSETSPATAKAVQGLPLRPRVAAVPAKTESRVMRSPLSKRRRQPNMLRLVDEDAAAQEPVNEDIQAVIQIYHKRIGMIGPTQYEKLKFWVEEQGMEGAVVALAIEETVRSADVPRISYLEGILRNWYNDGIRTLADIQERRRVSKVLASDPPPSERHEGMPNASAYQSVSSELVAKWKELYPDEYDS